MGSTRITSEKMYETIKEVVGEDSVDIVKYLQDKKNISDFKIAEVVKRDIHEVRNILYRLFNVNLVSYYRKKDRQKGWYISYWTFNKKRINDILTDLSKRKLTKFKTRLEEEQEYEGNFYICPQMCTRVGFDAAFDLEFRCPECGNVLNHQDNSKTITTIKEQIKKLETNGMRV